MSLLSVNSWKSERRNFNSFLCPVHVKETANEIDSDFAVACVCSQGEGVPLLPAEKKEIEELLPSGTSEEDKETIFSILGQAMCRPAGIQVRGGSSSQ